MAADVGAAVDAFPLREGRRTLRGYELGERLGEGAFAIVFAAEQASVGRTVAVKQHCGSLADQPAFVRQHPHILPWYDFWREAGSAFLVMRYLEGGSLQGRLRSEPLNSSELVPMAAQVGAALNAAHTAGVVHRDVKPANILLDGAGNAYLSDFGIAVEEAGRLDLEAWLSQGSPA